MPRNASGSYTLPSGNPVVSGTLIDATWANNTLADLGNEVTDSLSRSGEGAMLAPLRITDGVQATPSLAFSNEPSSGLYRAGSNEWWAVAAGVQNLRFTNTGLTTRAAAGAVGTPSIAAFNDTDTGIYFPGANELAIATGGAARMTFDSTGAVAVPGTFTLSAGTANGVLYLNGSKVATSGSALTFDGTNLGIGTASPNNKLQSSYSAPVSVPAAGAGGHGVAVGSAGYGLVGGALSSGNAYLQATRWDGSAINYDMVLQPNGGNLGLGVTPTTIVGSTGSNGNGFQTTSLTISSYSGTDQTYFATNAYTTSYIGGWTYRVTAPATRYDQASGYHIWYTAPSGTAGSAITFTQALTLDASGNLGLGNTNPASYGGFVAQLASGIALHSNSTSGVAGLNLYENGTGRFSLRTLNGSAGLSFYDTFNATERGRFTAGGYFKASNTGGYDSAAGTYHELLNNDADDYILVATHFGATNPQGFAIQFTAASPDNNTQVFLRCADNTTARCIIYSDGDLANHDGVYGTISDERLKQDIVDAGSQWDDLKSIRFRKYRMKTDVEANPDAPAMFGVVAQELAQVCPGLVDEHPNMKTVEVTDEEGNVTQTQEPDGTTTMTVKSSILLMKAAKALQEAMARIEQLEADMAALKASA